MPKKRVTKEGLARIIEKGFYGHSKRFDGMESKFDRIDRKLDILEQGQKEIIQILDKGLSF